MLITGAAGFIGNVACQHFKDRFCVIGVDDLSRLTSVAPSGIAAFIKTSVVEALPRVGPVDVVLHLAGQVSVMKSLEDPRSDFLRNAVTGLETALWSKEYGVRCLIYTNTNKVFGSMESEALLENSVRDECRLNPQTPYGVSKAVAGLYIRDLLPDSSFDFRMSCVYGDTQIGSEDQGWIGYIRRRVEQGEPITCYGDGWQVRDLLHVDDLMQLLDLVVAPAEFRSSSGSALAPGSYTVGGGWENAFTFRRVVELLGGKIDRYFPARLHDQAFFVSANEGVSRAGWEPKILAQNWMRRHSVCQEVLA